MSYIKSYTEFVNEMNLTNLNLPKVSAEDYYVFVGFAAGHRQMDKPLIKRIKLSIPSLYKDRPINDVVNYVETRLNTLSDEEYSTLIKNRELITLNEFQTSKGASTKFPVYSILIDWTEPVKVLAAHSSEDYAKDIKAKYKEWQINLLEDNN